MKKGKLLAILIPLGAVVTLAIGIAVPFIALGVKTSKLNIDYSYLKTDIDYKDEVKVSGVNLVTQHISCGYATIEMMSEFYGNKVTEDQLNDKNNGGVSTSSTGGFLFEINDSIPTQHFHVYNYLKNDELLVNIHDSLKKGNPVAIEWAAKYHEEWTLHFSLVTALNLSADNVTVYNPYGLIENIHLDEFISRTSFKAFTNMPLFLQFGFAFDAFHKNTIFYAI